ncbi:MAG TPA: hypothetical protein VFG35_24890 [Actinoplanes sp.]|nr:hypothetical protein [Actinoplanes sp.]
MADAFGPMLVTSVNQEARQMGANAVRLLVDRFTDRERRTVQINLSPPWPCFSPPPP